MALGAIINHLEQCKGDLRCPRCGRRMCSGCITKDTSMERPHKLGHLNECMICSGMYNKGDIILYPAEYKKAKYEVRKQRWNKYRLIRLKEAI